MKLWEKFLTEAGFEKHPKGWSEKSIKKSGKTLAKTIGLDSQRSKKFFEKCVERMKKHMGDGAKGYCASLKDEEYDSTYWRGKDKSQKKAAQMSKKYKNV